MDEDEFEAIMDEKPVKTEAEIMQWLQSLFLFSLCWSIGGNLDTDSRLKFSDFIKVLEAGTNKQHQRLELNFSNSFIMHQVKTKEIITVSVVWIPDLN